MSPEQRAQRVAAAHASWARTTNRVGRLTNAHAAAEARIAREYGIPDDLPPAEYATRIESAKKAHYRRLALKSAKARARRKAQRDAGAA